MSRKLYGNRNESGRKLPKSSQENMGGRRGAESLGVGYLECRWWNEALCLLKQQMGVAEMG